ncbi:MAG: hypothetical protein ARM1_0718 [Candidatus Micrarchaeota archaeon]|nr:MAG: hypothetical protein ARM1_0718 [Candidatus Micrarchaeota archaeon]
MIVDAVVIAMKDNLILLIVIVFLITLILALYYLGSLTKKLESSNMLSNLNASALNQSNKLYGNVIFNGKKESLANLIGRNYTLIWFVTTWCSACALGNQIINGTYPVFEALHIRIIEIELYEDLGYRGPSIEQFVNLTAPLPYGKGVIIVANSTYNLTKRYDPDGYLDIYYLVSPNGTILYENNTLADSYDSLIQYILKRQGFS